MPAPGRWSKTTRNVMRGSVLIPSHGRSSRFGHEADHLITPPIDSNAKMISVSGGHRGGGAPRRNRTGDPILTMEPPGTAVRTPVSPGRARPSGSKLSVLFRPSYAFPPVTADCRWSRPSSHPTVAYSARLPIYHLPLALG